MTLNNPVFLALALLGLSFLLSLLAIARNVRALRQEPTEESADISGTFEAVAQDWRVVLPHLIELRSRLFYAVLMLAATTAISFTFTPQLLEVLREPLPENANVVASTITDQLGMYMRIALTAGFILAVPFIATQFWIFIAQGLKSNERRYVYWFVPGATVLFAAGVAFAYFVMLPAAIPFLLSIFPDVPSLLRLSDYVADVTRLLFWVGLSFEMPLVLAALARVGFVTARQLLHSWRFAILGIAIVAALVTPTADPINMGLVMLPLFVLYLLSVLLAALVRREKRAPKPKKPRRRLRWFKRKART
ncbi:MAG TPA: twin-arginine translocase subunit TatC [Anaerolineae bacterium]|nr:twin-arginine translocase subunit TatC [Anaerolineae bacterium]